MKTIIHLVILNCLFATESIADRHVVPFFMQEFASKLGLDVQAINPAAPIHIEIERMVREAGIEHVIKMARCAEDTYLKGPYFLIQSLDHSVIIGKRYATEQGFVTLELNMFKDSTGRFNKVAFTVGRMAFGPGKGDERTILPLRDGAE